MKTRRNIMWNTTAFLLIAVLLATALPLSVLGGRAIADVTTWYVDDDLVEYPTANCTTIQEAVNAASSGDTIIVYSGTYTENVDVNKSLIIKSENGYADTTVQGSVTSDHVFDVQANNVTIGGVGHGFSIYGATDTFVAGIYLNGVSGCTIENNHCGWGDTRRNYYGIYLKLSSNNTLSNNICNNNSLGIGLDCSSINVLFGNTCNDNNSRGIWVYYSVFTEIKSNICNDNKTGIGLNHSDSSIVTDNTCNGNNSEYAGYGIHVYDTTNNTLTGNTCNDNNTGIFLEAHEYGIRNNVLSGNTCNNNSEYGININSSIINTISDNICNYNEFGICLSANGNILSGNTCNENDFGIFLAFNGYNTLTGNTCNDNNLCAITLINSSNNTFMGNTMVGDGIGIDGASLEHWNTHAIDTSNTVNGKPIYYWKDMDGGTVPAGAGQVILANCSNVVVENQDISDVNTGIKLGFSSSNTIDNNTCYNNISGVGLYSSNNNTLSGNICHSNCYGIYLRYSIGNTLSDNTCNNNYNDWMLNSGSGIYIRDSNDTILSANNCNDNDLNGIYLFGASSNNILLDNTCNYNESGICIVLNGSTSSNSNISGNTCENNKHGIYMCLSSDNTLYLNNFSGNSSSNVISDLISSNTWNSPEPMAYTYNGTTHTNYLGNYYSDYGGSDTAGDGIGDTALPYLTDGPGDSYPLMETSESYVLDPIPGDADGNGLVNTEDWLLVKDIILNSGGPQYGADADGDGDVDVFDWVLIKKMIIAP